MELSLTIYIHSRKGIHRIEPPRLGSGLPASLTLSFAGAQEVCCLGRARFLRDLFMSL